EQVEQSRLARPGRADDGDVLTRRHGEVAGVQGRDRRVAGVLPPRPDQLDHRRLGQPVRHGVPEGDGPGGAPVPAGACTPTTTRSPSLSGDADDAISAYPLAASPSVTSTSRGTPSAARTSTR